MKILNEQDVLINIIKENKIIEKNKIDKLSLKELDALKKGLYYIEHTNPTLIKSLIESDSKEERENLASIIYEKQTQTLSIKDAKHVVTSVATIQFGAEILIEILQYTNPALNIPLLEKVPGICAVLYIIIEEFKKDTHEKENIIN